VVPRKNTENLATEEHGLTRIWSVAYRAPLLASDGNPYQNLNKTGVRLWTDSSLVSRLVRSKAIRSSAHPTSRS